MYRKKLDAQWLGRMEPERVEHKLMAHVDALDTLLAQRRWLGGDDRSIANR